MKTKHFYIIFLLVAVCFSCKKRVYPESTQENEVIYYLDATIDNSPVHHEAGKDGYYMYASMQQDVNKVYNFIANMGCLENPGCPGSVKITINDFKVSDLDGPVKIDSSLQTKMYTVHSASVVTYKAEFQAMYNKTAATYKWNFGDGSTSTDANPTHEYAKSGVYNVCLTIQGTDGYISTICNEQKIGLNGCKTSISASTSGNALQFSQNTTGGTQPIEYLWDFGDGTRSTLPNPPPHVYAIEGSYPVKLIVKDFNNDVAIAHYNTLTPNDPSSGAANYKVVKETVVNHVGPFNLSEVFISWVNPDGKIFKSGSIFPGSDYFQILSVEEGDINELGQKTKRMHIKFKCTVYNAPYAPVLIDNADAVIAVAYK